MRNLLISIVLIMGISVAQAATEQRVFIVTDFGPFGSVKVNSSRLAVDALPNVIDDDHGNPVKIIKITLPVLWSEIPTKLDAQYKAASKNKKLIGILSSGDGGYFSTASIEISGENIEYGIDNNKVDKTGNPIFSGGPPWLYINYDVQSANLYINQNVKHSVPITQVATKGNAGTYLCNGVIYTDFNYVKGSNVFAGFVHIMEPSVMPTKTSTAILYNYIKFVINHPPNIQHT